MCKSQENTFKTLRGCDQFDDTSYMRAAYNVECGSAQYQATLIYAGLAMLIYPIGVPVATLVVLAPRRHFVAADVPLERRAQPRERRVHRLLDASLPLLLRHRLVLGERRPQPRLVPGEEDARKQREGRAHGGASDGAHGATARAARRRDRAEPSTIREALTRLFDVLAAAA